MTAPLPAFADPDDVARTPGGAVLLASTDARWWCEQLLAAAAAWIRKRLPDVLYGDQAARTVSIAVVRNALAAGDHIGHTSYQRTVGARTKAGSLADPSGALVWLPWMLEQLGIDEDSAGSAAGRPSWRFTGYTPIVDNTCRDHDVRSS